MSLVSPALTTTSTKKRKSTVTKAQQAELERGWRERNIRLRDMGLPKETLEQYTEWVYGRGKKTKAKTGSGLQCSKTVTKTPIPGRSSQLQNQQGNIQVQANIPGKLEENTMAPVRSKHWVTGPCSSKPSPTYTGTKILGIGTMHKSNAVPVFSDDEAKEISSMRR